MLRIRSRLGFSGVSRPAWILLAGNALDAVGLGIFFPILPLFVEHRGGTPLLVGVIGASALVGNVLAQAPGGWLADRYDRRLIVVSSIAAYGAFFLIYLIPIPVQVLPFVRFLHAGVGGFYMPAARALLADYTPADRRGMIFGHWQASSMGGFLIGPTIGGLLALVRLDLVFVSSAIAGGLGALLLSTLPPGLARDEAGRYEGPTGLPKVERHLLWLLLPAILAGAAYQYLGGVYGATWVLYVTALGGSPLIAGLSLSLYSLPLVLFSAAAGGLTDRYGVRLSVGLTLFFSALFATFYLLTRSIPVVLVLGVIEAFLTLGGMPAVLAEISRIVPSAQQGRAQGIFNIFTVGTQAAGSLVGGYLFGYGIAYPFASGAVVCLIALAAIPFLGRNRQASEPAPVAAC